MRCQLTSASASTATTLVAFGKQRGGGAPCVSTSMPSSLVT